jgi:hypothetical protein
MKSSIERLENLVRVSLEGNRDSGTSSSRGVCKSEN